MIDVLSVSKRYGDLCAVNDVTVSIPPGSFFGLLGPNGAGKTTLIRMMTGLIEPSTGDVQLEGNRMERDAVQEKRKIGVVSQHINLDKELTVRENLIFAGKLYGMKPKRIQEQTDKLLQLMRLEQAADRVCKKLSGGMKRKLMIAKALMHQPSYLFLDEPTVGVDATARRDIWAVLQSLNQAGTTILLTSHYIEEVAALCSQVALLNEGKLLQVDTPGGHIDRLGAVTVELGDSYPGQRAYHFRKREEALAYAEKLEGDFAVRETTLEDVFFAIARRRVSDHG